MFCVACGRDLEGDTVFCSYCGTPAKKVTREEFTVSSDDLVKKIRELIHEGNVTRIMVKSDSGETMLDMPATVGVVGTILAPWAAALGVIAALVTNCRIIVERRSK